MKEKERERVHKNKKENYSEIFLRNCLEELFPREDS